MSYGDDLARARQILTLLAGENTHVHKNPAPDAIVNTLTETRVMLQLRAWVSPGDYALARSELIEAILPRLMTEGLHLPSPTRELHVHHHDRAAVADALVEATQKPLG